MAVTRINKKQMSELDKEYEASLKSIETENKIDRIFYRPIGFRIARMLRGTGITPNMITVISIFVGAAVGFMFYHDNLTYNICGILLLVFAIFTTAWMGSWHVLQGSSPLSGVSWTDSPGISGSPRSISGFALRLSHDYGTDWFFALAVLSGLSHLVQANITDYYKTLHLYFISKDKGSEFQSLEQVEAKHKEMKYGINKFFYFLYRWYTMLQVKATPTLQRMLQNLHAKYGDNIPENIRVDFRKQSRHLMRYIDLLTFNGRTMVMFVIVLTGQVWAYYLYEIIVLNIVLAIVMRKHEKMCASFLG